jgi:hypothetical protein
MARTCGYQRGYSLLEIAVQTLLRAASYNLTFRKRSEFVITDTELKLIAAAARIGLSSSPNTG